MTIYLDAVWLLNILLDWMILLLTLSITRLPSNRFRIFFGAFIASLLVPISVFYPDSIVTSPFGKVFYSLLIVWCAFGFRNYRQYMKQLLFFYFVSFALGGGLIGLHFLLGNQFQATSSSILTFQSGYGDQVSWLFVGVGFPIVWVFTKSRMDKYAWEKFRLDQVYDVTLEIRNQSYTTSGYVDSGNQLVDPFSRKPVVICDQAFMSNWFSPSELKELQHAQEELSFDAIPSKWETFIQIVPYQGVDGNRTFMIVIKPDNLQVQFDQTQISTDKILIGVQFGELSADGSYHCLLHPQLFKHSVATSA
ncbi:sigma-E processing peptidase SpoIIGA [Radiobacillus kanasensis]|uniref:sigma-E processing peptidase SpoIIGA n=1 Tax=Radiobacillus kanasensis TaxID=2844358 RepID=UPI001E36087C|nr:sigma-E processing peptidase SpoIIGA [Radiobacillus kanasensis]UFU00952.1 sigma-E processing peptidase SpoIIGA [Radiobacillus kanasensis]